MKPGDKIEGPKVCKPGKPCGVLALLLKETDEQRPAAGGAGLVRGIGFSPGALSAPIFYVTGKSARKKTTIRIGWCPFCRGPLTPEAAEKLPKSIPLTPQRRARWVRKVLIVDELPEKLQQDLGLAHLDTCEHWMCKAVPCAGGAGCEWVGETRTTAAPKCCGVKA